MTCPKCSHLVNPYSGQCQNIHCDYVRGQALDSPHVELTPAFDFGPSLVPCATCGAETEYRLFHDHNGRTLCQGCFYAPAQVTPGVLADQIARVVSA